MCPRPLHIRQLLFTSITPATYFKTYGGDKTDEGVNGESGIRSCEIREWIILAGRRAARVYDSHFAVVQFALIQDGGRQVLRAPPLTRLVILT